MQLRMSKRAMSAAYLATTIVIALAFLSGGAVYLARVDVPARGITELGYPAYFVTILGTWKMLGGLAILAPRLPRLKEWAYAGIAFDLTGAAFSHAAAGDPAVKVIVPLVLLAMAIASWALRPASRKLASAAAEPALTSTEAREIARATS
jgi:uncharacterized membrane protein YphA (DoxX/SURF4 family)